MADARYPSGFEERIMEPAMGATIPVKKLSREDGNFRFGDLDVGVLWPPRDYKPPRGSYHDVNSASLVLRINYEGASFLFGGDVCNNVQDDIINERKAIHSEVMLAPHHGAKNCLNASFLKAVSPELIVISARWSNYRPFPDIGVLRRIGSSGATVLLTERDGAVRVRAKDGEIIASHWTGRRWKKVEKFESSR